MPPELTRQQGIRFSCGYSGPTPSIQEAYPDAYCHFEEPASTDSEAIVYVDVFRTSYSTLKSIVSNYTLAPSIDFDALVKFTIGQSNERGKGDSTASPDPSAGAYEYIDSSTGLVTLDDPVGDDNDTEARTGSSHPAFAQCLYELLGIDIIVVPEAVGGAAINSEANSTKYWDPREAGNLYDDTAKPHADDCLSYLTNNGYSNPRLFVTFNQGESDIAEIVNNGTITMDDWLEGYLALCDQIRSDYEADTQIFMSSTGNRDDGEWREQLEDFWQTQDQAAWARQYNYMSYTKTRQFNELGWLVDADTWHYNQTGLNDMGEQRALSVAAHLQAVS